MNGLLNAPVVMMAPTESTSSTNVSRRTRCSDEARNCWTLSKTAKPTSTRAATAKCPPGGRFNKPNSNPATTVIARLATASATRRVSRREPASPVDASAAANRPRPAVGFGRVRVELVGTPSKRGAGATQRPRLGEAYSLYLSPRRVRLEQTVRPVCTLVHSIGVLMIGLTGGIGSGKSTVALSLARRGAIVIDADVIAREVVESGSPALAKLVERFGADILHAD